MSSSLIRRLGFSVGRQLLTGARYRTLVVPAGLSQPLNQRWFSSDKPESKYTKEYFDGLVKEKPLVLFMKGNPSEPLCGFSRLVVQIFKMHGLENYPSYDVLEDVDFKESMKEYSNWPTFPQVYINGELLGGADIMLQLHQNGELISELEKIGHRSALLDTCSNS